MCVVLNGYIHSKQFCFYCQYEFPRAWLRVPNYEQKSVVESFAHDFVGSRLIIEGGYMDITQFI